MIRLVVTVLLGLVMTVAAYADATPRKLAPGVMTTIPPDRQEVETFSGPREMAELLRGTARLDWKPNYAPRTETLAELAKHVIFRRSVWCLEFSFKPLRMTWVDLPQANGEMKSQLVWYLVYKIRNTGFHLRPLPQPDRWGHVVYDVERVNHNVRFFPQLVLECFDQKKAYIDRVIPLAAERIRLIEDPALTFYNSVAVSEIDIPVSTAQEDHSIWCIATWVGVDPRTDFFGIFVQRLSNAYRWEESKDETLADNAAEKGRTYQYKTLQLNFWRPGDAVREHQSEVRFGMPAFEDVQGRTVATESELLRLYRVSQPRNHLWVYRP